MEKTVSKLPDPEVPEEELDAVSGGLSRPERFAPCKRCGERVSEKSLMSGYCKKCLDELHKMGFPPVL